MVPCQLLEMNKNSFPRLLVKILQIDLVCNWVSMIKLYGSSNLFLYMYIDKMPEQKHPRKSTLKKDAQEMSLNF